MKFIDTNKIKNATTSDIQVYSFNSVPYIKVEDLLNFIDNQPIVYDVNKVVEELKNQSFIDNQLNKVVDLDEATEIVKGRWKE